MALRNLGILLLVTTTLGSCGPSADPAVSSRDRSRADLSEVSTGGAQDEKGGYRSPTFDAPAGWYTDDGGTLPTDTTDQPGAWLSTYDFSQPEFTNLYYQLGELPRDGIAIEASIIGAEDYPSAPNANFAQRDLPLNLDDAEILQKWEGQIEDLPKYRILGTIEQHWVEVRVFFGRSHPTEEQYESAAAALETLQMPE